jgi:hypothetical protein
MDKLLVDSGGGSSGRTRVPSLDIETASSLMDIPFSLRLTTQG